MRFIDSHVHLCEYGERLSSLSLTFKSDTMLLSSGIDKSTSLATLEIAKTESTLVRAFVGTHPSGAQKETDLEWFEGALLEAAGAGELGLDPKYSEVVPHSPQSTVFLQQLEGGERAGKPVQIHSRRAEKACLEALTSYRVAPVLMHWFEGEAELGEVRDRGYFVSFGPAVLHSKKLQRMASRIDPARVLTESDGPVAFGTLGGAGGPSLIPTVIFKLAELWKETFSESEERLLRNGLSYLGEGGKT